MRVALHAVTGRRGGPRTYALSLLRALRALGDSADEYVLLADERVADDESGGAPYFRVPMPGGTAVRPLSEALAIPWAARRARADVVHCTKQTLPRGVPGRTVVTVLDLAPHLFPETFSAVAGLYLRRATAGAVRRADRVVAISEHTAADLRRHLAVPDDRISVVPLGVDDRFRAVPTADEIARVRARHGLPERYLLSVGTIQPRKNVDVALDALDLLATRADLPPLVLAGRTGWMVDAVVERARAHPGVQVLGDVPDADLPALLAGAHVFLSPSSYEGFGLAVAEAMATGVPVVAGQGSATDEVVGAAGLLVPPRDGNALAAAITGLLDNEGERVRLGRAGRERVARFTWEATARGTREVYRQLVGDAR